MGLAMAMTAQEWRDRREARLRHAADMAASMERSGRPDLMRGASEVLEREVAGVHGAPLPSAREDDELARLQAAADRFGARIEAKRPVAADPAIAVPSVDPARVAAQARFEEDKRLTERQQEQRWFTSQADQNKRFFDAQADNQKRFQEQQRLNAERLNNERIAQERWMRQQQELLSWRRENPTLIDRAIDKVTDLAMDGAVKGTVYTLAGKAAVGAAIAAAPTVAAVATTGAAVVATGATLYAGARVAGFLAEKGIEAWRERRQEQERQAKAEAEAEPQPNPYQQPR